MTNTMVNRVRRALSPLGRSARVLIAVVLAGAITSACDVHGVTAPGTLASMTVTPDTTLIEGTTAPMIAKGFDADGRYIPVSPTWTVALGGGTITSTGLFTAGATPGLFAHTVVASVGSISANASITVLPGALATITVFPNPGTLPTGGTLTFTAVGKDAVGNIVQVTPSWSVVNATAGTINSGTGLFTAGMVAGTYPGTVQATSGAISGFATVKVVAGTLFSITVKPASDTLIVGTTQQYTVVGQDASGNVVAITPTWSVVNVTAGTINSAGLFTAGTVAGAYPNTVQATSGAISGVATVNVVAGALATITVSPPSDTLSVGAPQQFTAVGKDVNGNPVVIVPNWSVGNATAGSINGSTGLFTAGTVPGAYPGTVRAASGAISGFATVNVVAGTLASIMVTPNPDTLSAGAKQQFIAVGKDANGNTVGIVPAPTWSVVNVTAGIINSTGLFTAGTVAGTYTNTVQAKSSSGISGFATVVVAAGPLASITVTPNPDTLSVGGRQTFTAVGYDVNGNTVGIVPAPVWSVVNGGGGIDGGTGLFIAGTVPGTYTNTVQAKSGSISGSATVVVLAPPVSPLGTAAKYGIISGAAINCGTPSIPGHVSGLSSPANLVSGNSTVIGFPPCTLDGVIITDPLVYATAMSDLVTAYLAAQAITGCTVLTGTDLGGLNLPPGTYCFATSAGLTGNLTLTGSATDKWTFQIGSALTTAVGSTVTLAGGAIADNVYWAVGSAATLGTTSDFSGNIMSMAAITLNAGATLHGRAMAQTAAVSMIQGGSRIIKP